MRIIAYKTAGNINSRIKGSLPDSYITEWTYTDIQPQELNEEDGWQFIDEDQFQILLQTTNDNDQLNLWKQEQNRIRQELKDSQLNDLTNQQEQIDLINEFEQFKLWKASQNG
jgi:hypothetical protein